MLDEFGAEGAHGRIFLDAVAVWDDDDAGNALRAAARAIDWPWLPRVAEITPLMGMPDRFSASM